MLPRSRRTRLISLIQALALLALAFRTLLPLAHGSCADHHEAISGTFVVEVHETHDDDGHAASSCPICKTLRNAGPCALDGSILAWQLQSPPDHPGGDNPLFHTRELDLSSGGPRAPPLG